MFHVKRVTVRGISDASLIHGRARVTRHPADEPAVVSNRVRIVILGLVFHVKRGTVRNVVLARGGSAPRASLNQ